jgi:HK97 family phage major capsid protein
MKKRLKELREKRLKAVHDARAILDKADAEKREMTSEEKGQWDAHMNDERKYADQIGVLERQIQAEAELGQIAEPGTDTRSDPTGGADDPAKKEARIASIFGRYIRGGLQSLAPADIQELRGLSADKDTEGGFLVAPLQWVDSLLKDVDNLVVIRGLATKHRVATAQALGVPTLDVDVSDAEWTSELATGGETDMKCGKRELHPHPLAKRVKASNKLLRMTGQPEALVRSRLAYKFAVSEEKAFMTGDGAKKPLGLFTPSNDGIPTSRDVNTGSATGFKFEGLIDAKYSLKAQHMRNARWLFHRDAIKILAKIRDESDGPGTGPFIWQPAVREGVPDMLLGHGVLNCEYAPNTFTNGLYSGMFADFSWYWIADALDMQVQRLVELYAETNQVGFIGRAEVDGMPVLAEAFARLKCAA